MDLMNSADTYRMPVTELVLQSPTRQKSLDEYANEFLAGYDNELTQKNYASDLRSFLDETKGNLSDESVLVYRKLILSTMKPRSAHRRLCTARSFMDSLVLKGVLGRNPYHGIKKLLPKIDRHDGRPEALTDAEVRSMMDYCMGVSESAVSSSVRLLGLSQNLALVMGFHLGLRVSEVVSVRVGDVASGKLLIKGKGNRVRTLLLDSELMEKISGYIRATSLREDGTRDPGEFLLVGRESHGSDKVDTDTVNRWWKAVARACGINKRITSHTGRATAVTKLLDEETPLRDVMVFAGHASVETTMIYDRKQRESSVRIIGKIRY